MGVKTVNLATPENDAWLRRVRVTASLEFGDTPGHPFHGNQYTDVAGADDAMRRLAGTAEGYARIKGLRPGSGGAFTYVAKQWAYSLEQVDRAQAAADYVTNPVQHPGGKEAAADPATAFVARELLGAVHDPAHPYHVDIEPPQRLFRGMRDVDGSVLRNFPLNMNVTFSLASFSRDPEVPDMMFHIHDLTAPPWEEAAKIILMTEGPVGGADVGKGGSPFDEIVTGGTFHVTEVSEFPPTEENEFFKTTRITIKQVQP